MADSANGHDESGEEIEEHEIEFRILTQYVKDMSFESPNAPKSLMRAGENFNIKFGIGVEAKPIELEEDTYEVSIELTVDAKNKEGFVYKLEVIYAGLFAVKGVPKEMLRPFLFIECPGQIFPYLRHTVTHITQEGGFPPLRIDPIDFGRLYQQNAEQGGEEEENSTVN